MPATVVVGTQWGDEGKGKVIDVLASGADWTVRFQGGANAGHTIWIGKDRFALHLLPSGVVREGVRCALGWGMVIDPDRLLEEIEGLEERGISIRPRLLISARASLLLPHHRVLDGLEEAERGGAGLGTTRRGIGPAYQDRSARCALLFADLLCEEGAGRLRTAHERLNASIARAGGSEASWEEIEACWARWKAEIGPIVGDPATEVHEALERGETVLFEGAQGTHLDLYAGTYPHVTSSFCLAGGACAGFGIGPGRIERVIGVAKGYVTRVGTGPFPTELTGEEGDRLRERGDERGTTTGRPRRCGWLDIPLLRAAVRWNGVTGIALTKVDVLSGRERIPVASAYRMGESRLEIPPPSPHDLARVRPVYEEWPGWEEIPRGASHIDELPAGLVEYAQKIASAAGAPVVMISTGPERSATIPCRIAP